jgi:hypothetical protein
LLLFAAGGAGAAAAGAAGGGTDDVEVFVGGGGDCGDGTGTDLWCANRFWLERSHRFVKTSSGTHTSYVLHLVVRLTVLQVRLSLRVQHWRCATGIRDESEGNEKCRDGQRILLSRVTVEVGIGICSVRLDTVRTSLNVSASSALRVRAA